VESLEREIVRLNRLLDANKEITEDEFLDDLFEGLWLNELNTEFDFEFTVPSSITDTASNSVC
jgi:hypothetical protein